MYKTLNVNVIEQDAVKVRHLEIAFSQQCQVIICNGRKKIEISAN